MSFVLFYFKIGLYDSTNHKTYLIVGHRTVFINKNPALLSLST